MVKALSSFVYVIDARIPLLDTIVADASTKGEVCLVTPDRCGLDQVAHFLSRKSDIKALHFISHGRDGALQLGSGLLDSASLVELEDSLRRISSSLSDTADVLLYGCNIARTDNGKNFVREFADRLGANVAASSTPTGEQSLGGDWQLNYQVGPISTAIGLSDATMADFPGILPVFDFTGGAIGIDADNNPTYTEEVDGLTLTVTANANLEESIDWVNLPIDSSFDPNGDVLFLQDETNTLSFTDTTIDFDFSAPVDILNFDFLDFAPGRDYTFTPNNSQQAVVVSAESMSDYVEEVDLSSAWSAPITGFSLTTNLSETGFLAIFDAIEFSRAVVELTDTNDAVAVWAGDGDDFVNGHLGNDTLGGGAGNDTIGGSGGDDMVYAGADADTVFANSGDDRIFGGSGNDLIYAGLGNDSIYGGAGDDTLFGGAGDDVFFASSGFGDDVIFGFETDGGDLLDLSMTGVTGMSDLLLTQQDADVLINAGDGTILLVDTLLDQMTDDHFVF